MPDLYLENLKNSPNIHVEQSAREYSESPRHILGRDINSNDLREHLLVSSYFLL